MGQQFPADVVWQEYHITDRYCPCSVREQPPTHADSNQERVGNIEELSDVTDAAWSL
jgi:hypothetical protein